MTQCSRCNSPIYGPVRKAAITKDSNPVDLCRRCYDDHQVGLEPKCYLCGARMPPGTPAAGSENLICVKCVAEEPQSPQEPQKGHEMTKDEREPPPGHFRDTSPATPQPPQTLQDVQTKARDEAGIPELLTPEEAHAKYLETAAQDGLAAGPGWPPKPETPTHNPLDTLRTAKCCLTCKSWDSEYDHAPVRCQRWNGKHGVNWPECNVCDLYAPKDPK